MTHHTPATPGSTRSIVAPHMFVTGGTREMLREDLHLARRLMVDAENDLNEFLSRVMASTGGDRKTWRRLVVYACYSLRQANTAHKEALARFYAFKRAGE